jgi:hypothetical protein
MTFFEWFAIAGAAEIAALIVLSAFLMGAYKGRMNEEDE